MTALKKQPHTEESPQRNDSDGRKQGGAYRAAQLAQPGDEGDAKTPGPIWPTRESSLRLVRPAEAQSDATAAAKTPGPIWPTRDTFAIRLRKLMQRLGKLFEA